MNGAVQQEVQRETTGVVAVRLELSPSGKKRVRVSEIFSEYVFDAILIATLAIRFFIHG